RQVLGVVAVADTHVQVAVDPVEVDQVELFERSAVALLGTADEAAHALRLALLLRRPDLTHRSRTSVPPRARRLTLLGDGPEADTAFTGKTLDVHDPLEQ